MGYDAATIRTIQSLSFAVRNTPIPCSWSEFLNAFRDRFDYITRLDRTSKPEGNAK